jgi:hypothetical protein
MTPCTITDHYADGEGQAFWAGRSIADDPDFLAYLKGPVRSRLEDEEQAGPFAAELSALATTGLGAETVEAVLTGQARERKPWEVGEALAEVLLEDHHQAVWPWNTERDKRTPKASLPGADLVGFVALGETDAVLAIGEVKTSADVSTPPGVMDGRSGMAHQLQQYEGNPDLQGTILKWLRARCRSTDFWPYYESAVGRYLNSGARDFVLFGVLMRDTQPHVLDLENRGKTLGTAASDPTAYQLTAWHLPRPVADWPDLVLLDDHNV